MELQPSCFSLAVIWQFMAARIRSSNVAWLCLCQTCRVCRLWRLIWLRDYYCCWLTFWDIYCIQSTHFGALIACLACVFLFLFLFFKIWDQHTCSLFLRLCLTTNSLLKEYSAIIFKRVTSVLILVWHFAELYNCWSIVESCRLAQCICSIRWGYSVMFHWSWSTYFCVFGALVALHVYLCRDRYTPQFCLFADDGAFILASTLVPVEEFDDQSAWLRVVNEDPHSCSTHEADMFWNVQKSQVFADFILNFGRVVHLFWLWNVVDWHNAFVL